MKLTNVVAALGMTFAASFAMASTGNLALVCSGQSGEVKIYTSEKTDVPTKRSNLGRMYSNEDWELGQVQAVSTTSSSSLRKVADGKRTLFGKKKGFGVYENNQYRLDIRDTSDRYKSIYLEDKITGESMDCLVNRNSTPWCC